MTGFSCDGCPTESLTHAQIDIWLEQSLHPNSTQYIITTYYPMSVRLDTRRFIEAADWVFSSNSALYAQLVPGGDGVPRMRFDPAKATRCRYVDLSGEKDPQQALLEHMRRQAWTPFPLIEAHLFRPVLAKTGEAAFCYFCSHHHTMIDGWGSGIVFGRIAKAYEDMGRGLEPHVEGADFIDFLHESRDPLDSVFLAKAEAFWKPLLAAPVPPLRPSHSLAADMDVHAATHVEATLSRELADRVARQAAASGSTLFHAFLLAFGWALRLQFSLESCSLALPILNRRREYKETIGPFVEVRTVPIPLDENAGVDDNMKAISRLVRELFRYYRLPGSEIVRLHEAQGNTGVPNGHGTLSYITRDFSASIEGAPIHMGDLPAAHQTSPCTLFVFDTAPGQDIVLQFVFQRRYLDADEAGLFLQRLMHLMEGVAADPRCALGDVDMVPVDERRRIAAALRRDHEYLPVERLVIHDILERARVVPESVAVETPTVRCTYRECIARACALAHALTAQHGVRPGDAVALLLPRGVEIVASLLATMLTGSTAVPIDPDEPELRARHKCGDCEAKCVISNRQLRERAGAVHPAVLLADEIAPSDAPFTPLAEPEQVAYIIYTSGTTGKPKGVEITHRALADHLQTWFQSIPMLGGTERALWFCSAAFDAAVECIFPVLMRGNTILTAPHPQWSAYEMPRVIVEWRVTRLFVPPAYLIEMLKDVRQHPERLRGHVLRTCLTGGDVMHTEMAVLWNEVFGSSATLVNVYGPTETTVTATIYAVPPGYRPTPDESVPIGRAHQGRVLRVVNGRGRDVPIGVEGELLIGGIGLAKGYRGMPGETGARFVVLEDGVRYYRSGDVVRLRTDGHLVFRRRQDQQVKIRGFRIEPAEIEACLLAHPDVKECAVLVVGGAGEGEKELRAFVALGAGFGGDTRTLRDFLAVRLPAYMIPTIVIADALPRNTSGKIDRKALRETPDVKPAPARAEAPSRFPPRGPVQEYLALLWRETLGGAADDVRADFFSSGGHSLLAAKFVARVGKAFRVDYAFSTFYAQPTIEHTVRNLERLVGDRAKLERMAALRLEFSRLSPEEIKSRLEQVRRGRPAADNAVLCANP